NTVNLNWRDSDENSYQAYRFKNLQARARKISFHHARLQFRRTKITDTSGCVSSRILLQHKDAAGASTKVTIERKEIARAWMRKRTHFAHCSQTGSSRYGKRY